MSRPLSFTAVVLLISGLTGCADGGSSGGEGAAAPLPLPTGVRAIAVDVAGSLNLRHGPGASFEKRATMGPGETYVVFGQDGDWVQVWYDDAPGWLHSGYSRAAASAEVRGVIPDSLNVRSGPDLSYSLVGRVHGGSLRAVVERQGDWSRIDFGGQEGWVLNEHLGEAALAFEPLPARPRSTRGFIQFPSSAPGVMSYKPGKNQWGTPRLIYGLERIARIWDREHPDWPRMQLGDISYENGGSMYGHKSHQKGVDCDVRLIRSNDTEGYTTLSHSKYSRDRTAALIGLYQEHLPIKFVFFNDNSVPGVSYWPNHANHFHARCYE